MNFIKMLAIMSLVWMLPAVSRAQETADPRGKSSPSGISEPARNTTTGKDFEKLVKQALEFGGYEVKEQVQAGTRPNGGKHMIDLVAVRGDRSLLISLKWQQSAGTAEQKVPYEVICLSEALEQTAGQYEKAYLVLGGEGWTLKEFYLGEGMKKHLNLPHPVSVISVEEFVLLARQKTL